MYIQLCKKSDYFKTCQSNIHNVFQRVIHSNSSIKNKCDIKWTCYEIFPRREPSVLVTKLTDKARCFYFISYSYLRFLVWYKTPWNRHKLFAIIYNFMTKIKDKKIIDISTNVSDQEHHGKTNYLTQNKYC